VETIERCALRTFPAEVVHEHLSRYAFAAQFVVGKRVLDVACGTGYGSAILEAAGSQLVIPIDISREACVAARLDHNVGPVIASALALPIREEALDVVVCFETIEHVNDPTGLVRELRRVLSPEGMLVLSAPNGPYDNPHNAFHVSRFGRGDIEAMLSDRFRSRIYTVTSKLRYLADLSRSLAYAVRPCRRVG